MLFLSFKPNKLFVLFTSHFLYFLYPDFAIFPSVAGRQKPEGSPEEQITAPSAFVIIQKCRSFAYFVLKLSSNNFTTG